MILVTIMTVGAGIILLFCRRSGWRCRAPYCEHEPFATKAELRLHWKDAHQWR